jgi:hypothetical protein
LDNFWNFFLFLFFSIPCFLSCIRFGKKIILAGTEVGLRNLVCHIISNSFVFQSFLSAPRSVIVLGRWRTEWRLWRHGRRWSWGRRHPRWRWHRQLLRLGLRPLNVLQWIRKRCKKCPMLLNFYSCNLQLFVIK